MAFSPSQESVDAGDRSRFENMMKLLLFLEAELQMKEEIIELLLEDERNQEMLNEKLTRLNRKDCDDPVLALGRDNIYVEELWDEHVEEWGTGKGSPFDHVIRSNASQLCAVAAMRTVETARAHLQKYIRTYETLEKAGKNYKKLKKQLSIKEHKAVVHEIAQESGSEWDVRELEMKVGELYLQIDSERQKNEELERKIEELSAIIGKERKKCRKVIESLANEVERLTNLVKAQGKNGHHTNGIKLNHDRQDTIKLASNHVQTYSVTNNTEFKQFCVL